jgi:prevent-host-death family protein
MKVTMTELNKQANQIVRQVVDNGEPAVILKHGKPIAEIRPIADHSQRSQALDFLCSLQPVPMDIAPEELLAQARNRGV